MAVLQLTAPCLAVAGVVPAFAPQPPPSPDKNAPQAVPLKPAALAQPPLPLTVVGTRGVLLLLEIVTDPESRAAEAALQAVHQSTLRCGL